MTSRRKRLSLGGAPPGEEGGSAHHGEAGGFQLGPAEVELHQDSACMECSFRLMASSVGARNRGSHPGPRPRLPACSSSWRHSCKQAPCRASAAPHGTGLGAAPSVGPKSLRSGRLSTAPPLPPPSGAGPRSDMARCSQVPFPGPSCATAWEVFPPTGCPEVAEENGWNLSCKKASCKERNQTV
ncbi:sterile alpha motif domain-containing protein 1-like isoform X2 [Rhineura floridana]|uniref:sterile alpha motif domain-containing protein 1-like isoform X2 n=1 Tax=Rhineura floridana TaxID=261503 RepID=UPI002AC7FA18|nr:sterile alpha motif domain-containing protein 1-like isoform X2 [Rhineura floridana]